MNEIATVIDKCAEQALRGQPVIGVISDIIERSERRAHMVFDQYIAPERYGHILEDAGEVERLVNSIHMQGVQVLAPNLRVEAVAEDGLIEAFSVKTTPGFAFAVQWHPEWDIQDNELSQAIFGAFSKACRSYQSLDKSD